MAFRTEYFGQMRREKGVKKYKNCAEFIYELPLRDMVPVRGSPAPMTTKPEWFFFDGFACSGISIAGPGGMNRSNREI